ncbi:hypothetical protein Pyrfu_0529 [Pyrolobus fumarii 1A]|uniref:PIN domain-containing protein n=1 Tax=Pyrolobus fumarii (strain DSM 11204 / 1A) TaxID=694429 RepID=G0EGM6_PYRF1|nr:hypothetical protein [Pyrolobus fumarii]AEM38400.1 hypothetical protein Pyrfu_0529 [Pyrolobus fumarii 1A]
MAKRRSRRRGRCKYYVNTNFFVDLSEERSEAVSFARRNRGVICTSTVLVFEYRQYEKGFVARSIARRYDIRIYRVPVLALLSEARDLAGPHASINTIFDYAHILAAKMIGAEYMVTSDKGACNKAIELGLCCINHGSGGERCLTRG